MDVAASSAISNDSQQHRWLVGNSANVVPSMKTPSTPNWSLWTFVVLTLVGLLYWRWTRSRSVRLINSLPGPKTLPFLGNFLDLNVDHDEFLKIVHFKWIREFGNIYRAWGGMRPVVILSAPELMEPILVSQKHITKAVEYSYLSPWLGNCMFLTTGERWKTRRRLLTPAFHFQILNSFIDVFNEQSLICADAITEAIGKNGLEIDIFPFMTQCALDIICETSMGRQTRSAKEKAEYVENLHRIGQIVMERGIRPWLTLDWIYWLSPLGRENQKCVKALHAFTNQVIRDRRRALQNMEAEKGTPNNNDNESNDDATLPRERLAFLDLLIKASESGAQLSDDDIREEVDTVMFAGHDTTASAMTWFCYCIARHPEEQELVMEELDRVFGTEEESWDRPCTNQDLSELKYLECCIKETLRLYPSVPAVMRSITEEIEIGGHVIPAGSSIALMIYGMHHNPEVYPDPESFKPERFLPENSKGRHPYAFIPFSAGPRNCIGQKYGLLEIKVVLANLLRRFRFALADPTKPMLIPSSEVVLKPKNGVPIIVTPRR